MCAAFGKTIGLDRDILETHVPKMTRQLQTLFESSARLTLFPPSLAAKLQLGVWKSFEKAALSALETANQLTETCLQRLAQPGEEGEESSGCIVSSLRQQQVANVDIQRIIADLFLAAADTVNNCSFLLLRNCLNRTSNRHRIRRSGCFTCWRNIPTFKKELSKKSLQLMKGPVTNGNRFPR